MTILLVGALLLLPLENWVHRQCVGMTDALAEHVVLPMARTLVLVTFLFAIYPQPLASHELLSALGEGNWQRPELSSLFNLVFLAGLIVPIFPAMQYFNALVLSIQTLLGGWLLLAALPHGPEVQLLLAHGRQPVVEFLVLGVCSHFALRWIGGVLHRKQHWDALSAYDTLALITQPPLALWVTRDLVWR